MDRHSGYRRVALQIAIGFIGLILVLYFYISFRGDYLPMLRTPAPVFTSIPGSLGSVGEIVLTGWDVRPAGERIVEESNCEGQSALHRTYPLPSGPSRVRIDTAVLGKASASQQRQIEALIVEAVENNRSRPADIYGSAESTVIELVVEPGQKQTFLLREMELWRLGYVLVEESSGNTDIIPFAVLVDVSYEVQDSLEIACASTVAPGTAVATTEAASTVLPTDQPWLEPTDAEQTPGENGEHTVGDLEVEYPVQMDLGSSEVVTASIRISDLLPLLDFVNFERVGIHPGMTFDEGALTKYGATIPVRQQMRLELQSPTFSIEALYPASQFVDLNNSLNETKWAWTVVAPDRIGPHVLTLRAYSGDQAVPAWTGAFTIDVTAAGTEADEGTPAAANTEMALAATATSLADAVASVVTTGSAPAPAPTADLDLTPTPTATVEPAPQPPWDRTALAVAGIGLMGVLFTGYITYIVAKKFGSNRPDSAKNATGANPKPKKKS